MKEEKIKIKASKKQYEFWKALADRQKAIREHIRAGKPLSEIPNIQLVKPF